MFEWAGGDHSTRFVTDTYQGCGGCGLNYSYSTYHFEGRDQRAPHTTMLPTSWNLNYCFSFDEFVQVYLEKELLN